MIDDINEILDTLDISIKGKYENHFYVIQLENSDEYAKIYTKLDENAVNTEYPQFQVNNSKNTVKVTNYFELDINSIIYNIFLIANFETDEYYLKIGEK